MWVLEGKGSVHCVPGDWICLLSYGKFPLRKMLLVLTQNEFQILRYLITRDNERCRN